MEKCRISHVCSNRYTFLRLDGLRLGGLTRPGSAPSVG